MPLRRGWRKSERAVARDILLAPRDSPADGVVVLRLLVIVAGLALAAATAYLTFVGAPGARRPSASINATVGDVRLRFNSAYLPQGATRTSAGLELVAVFPDFRPIPPANRGVDLPPTEDVVVLRLEPQDATLDPMERMTKLYAGFLEAESWSHPGGLIMRRFEKGSPYEAEDLYLAPPEGRRFAARCQMPPRKPDGLPSTCLWTFRMSGLDVQMRFSPDLLSSWELLVERGHGLVASVLR